MSEITIDGSAAATTTASSTARTAQLPPIVLSLVRIVVSFLWMCHGLEDLFGAFGGVNGHGGHLTMSSGVGFWAAVIETFVGAIVLLGLATRPAAVFCSGTMAFAYFTVHAPKGLLPLLNGGELSALYSWIFLLIAVFGPGAIAVDTLIRRRRATRS